MSLFRIPVLALAVFAASASAQVTKAGEKSKHVMPKKFYYKLINMDMGGHLQHGLPNAQQPELCRDECNNYINGCKTAIFGPNDGACFLKDHNDQLRPELGLVTYVQFDINSGRGNYTEKKELNYLWNDIMHYPHGNADSCAFVCDLTPGCLGFAIITGKNEWNLRGCYLKSKLENEEKAPHSSVYVKQFKRLEFLLNNEPQCAYTAMGDYNGKQHDHTLMYKPCKDVSFNERSTFTVNSEGRFRSASGHAPSYWEPSVGKDADLWVVVSDEFHGNKVFFENGEVIAKGKDFQTCLIAASDGWLVYRHAQASKDVGCIKFTLS